MNDTGNPTNARSADVFQVNAFGVKYGFEKSRWGHRTRKLRRNRPLAWGQRPERETFMEKTNKFAAYLTEEQKYKITRCQDLDGSRSGTEVIRRAVDFYHDYLTTKHSGAWIPTQVMCGRTSSLCTGMTQLDWVTTMQRHGEIFCVRTVTRLRQR